MLRGALPPSQPSTGFEIGINAVTASGMPLGAERFVNGRQYATVTENRSSFISHLQRELNRARQVQK
jgi:hypothetical protein